MKKLLFSFLIISINISIFSFGAKEVQVNAKDKIVAALILDSPGLGDDSINDSCYMGLQQAADEGLITLRVKTSGGLDDSVDILTGFVEDQVNIIYAIGDNNRQLLIDASKLYKNTIFIGVDIYFSETEIRENLYGITFREQDGGYLAGLVAGNLTYKYNKRHQFFNEINRVGIILGKNSSAIKSYELGFYAGVKNSNPPCEIISININDLQNPEKGFDAVSELKQKGVDIIFTIAGDSNSGVFSAAEESGILVIAANKDHSSKSDVVLTSVVKKISVSTYLITKSYIEGLYETGINVIYGLNEGAISLAPYYKFDKYIPKDLGNLIKTMSQKLIKGSEVIPQSINDIVFDPEKIPVIEE